MGIYLHIYVETDLRCRGFFSRAGVPPIDACSRCGRYFPWLQRIPGIFDTTETAPGTRGGQGKVVPMVAIPGSPPDQTGIPVCHLGSHRSLIPAIHPY